MGKIRTSIILIILSLIMIPSICFAKRLHSEWWYTNKWCGPHGGKMKAVLNDGTKCDCMTADYVVEVEYANRWKNAIGKVLHYSLQTGKRSTIVLILERPRDQLYLDQLKTLIQYFSLPIDIWEIGDGVSDTKTSIGTSDRPE